MSEISANDAMYEELTAYLDGELDAAARGRVEERLARDEAYRHELQRLERSWEMLDRLPQVVVDDAFAQSTLEMVAVAAESEAEPEISHAPRRRRIGWIVSAGLLAASVAGFAFGHLLWPDPNQRLLRDLPVLENFDAYRHGDSIEFLRLLDRERLFAQEEAHAR